MIWLDVYQDGVMKVLTGLWTILKLVMCFLESKILNIKSQLIHKA